MFYTYAHYKPQGGLFYIGKGKRRRAFAMDGRNSHWHNIVNKYGRPHVELLAGWKTEEEAFSHEKLLIASFRDMGFELANKSDGGEGSSGYKHTEESKRKNSQAKMGSVPWNKGKVGVMPEAWNKGIKTPEEVRIKQSMAKLGKPSHRKGVKHTPEALAKMSVAHKGKPVSEATKQALKLANKGRKFDVVECPHCNKIGGLTAMPRWHFDNCKLKGIQYDKHS